MSEQVALDYGDFEPLVGESFALALEGQVLELKLQSADRLNAKGRGARTKQFSLLFVGPAEPVLAQRTYEVKNQALGSVEIFLVPVGKDEKGTEYEAIFT